MIDQPPTPAVTGRNPWIAVVLPWVLIGQFLWNLLTPAHEFPMRAEQVMTMAIDALMLAGLIGLKAAMPKALFWVALVAGVGLFALRLSSDGWWTGHLVYSLPPRRRLRMTRTIDDIIGEASRLPVRDAAYLIWREKTTFERLEGRRWRPRDMRTPAVAARSMRRISAQLKRERNTAQDGPTFDRLKRAHPRADDAELKQAIVAAVKFDDDCFRYFSSDGGDYWDNVVRAVARAGKDHPLYLATTYRDARNWVAYNMK